MYLTLGYRFSGGCKTYQIDPKHPLFKDCIPHTEKEIEEISENGTDEELVLALRSCLRYNVARIVGRWQMEAHVDDLINEGMLALVEWAPNRHNSKSDRSTMKRATSHLINALENYLNRNVALSSAGKTKQKELIAAGEDPIYLEATQSDYSQCDVEERDPDIYKRDVMDVLEAMETDEIDEYILCQSSWGRTHRELAEEIGVDETTISRRRKRLHQQFLKLSE